MAELLASRTLRRWADYRRLGSLYLKRSADGLAAELAEIDRMLPGSAQLVPAAELDWALDWAEVPADAVAVRERDAGYLAPDRFRAAGLADALLADAVRVTVRPGAVHALTLGDNGTIGCDGRDYDVVILALGAWTGRFLRATGLPSEGYRVKSIQYAIHRTGSWRPPHFVDEITGLYGRPTAYGELLLGLPTNVWDVDPDRPPTDPAVLDAAAELARARLARLRLGPAARQVGSADCYADQPLLALRPVAGLQHRLFTFSGGAGGSVKTALAASHRAATQLVEPQLNSLRTA